MALDSDKLIFDRGDVQPVAFDVVRGTVLDRCRQ
jgi:hypothetical protein